jgi:hypothetical protein
MGIEKAKSIFKSKTVWGGLIALLPALSDAAQQVAGIPFLPPHFAATVAAVGGTLAILGRLVAKVPLKL